jgi:hypothetical protein
MANTSTLITRRDYGLKIAMPGFDAMYAGDNQLLFNSSFPILQIKVLSKLYSLANGSTQANQGGEYIGTIGNPPYDVPVFRWYHGLGYPPFFLVLGTNGFIYNDVYTVDDQYIYRKGVYDFNTGSVLWPTDSGAKVLLCPIDLTRDIEYPYTALPLQKPQINSIDYGFKSAEYGELNDPNFNNLGINIRLQSQMVLAVKTMETSTIPGGATDFTVIPIDYTLPAGMSSSDVISYGFVKQNLDFNDTTLQTWRPVGASGQAVPSTFIDYPFVGNFELQTFKSQPGALVITRLPMVAATKTESTI